MVDIIQAPGCSCHGGASSSISATENFLPNMTLLVLDTASQLASLAVLVLVVVFPYRSTKEPSPTQDPTCKLVAAVQHIPAAAAQAGHLLGLHLLPAAVM